MTVSFVLVVAAHASVEGCPCFFSAPVFFLYFLNCYSPDVNTASFTLQTVAPADGQAVRIVE